MSELKLIKVNLEMLPADGTMVSANPASLKQGQSVVSLLQRIGREVAFLSLVMLSMRPRAKRLFAEATPPICCYLTRIFQIPIRKGLGSFDRQSGECSIRTRPCTSTATRTRAFVPLGRPTC